MTIPDNIRVEIFRSPSVAEKKRVHPNHMTLMDTDLTDRGLPRRIAISFEEDLFFIPPEHNLIPDEIPTPFGIKRLDRDYRKFWRRANILSLSTRTPDSQTAFRGQMRNILPSDYIRAYSWKSAGNPRIYVPLTSLIDGRRLYFTVTKSFPQLGIRDEMEVRSYGPESVIRLPSRSMEEVRRYTIRFVNLSTSESREPWYRLEPHHSCDDKEYKLRSEGQFADDHIVAAFTAVEFARLGTSDPIVQSPFLIPSRTLVTLDRRLREQVIKLYFPEGSPKQEERNLTEAERELLLWRFIGEIYLQEGRRSYDMLFVDTYDGVAEYFAIAA